MASTTGNAPLADTIPSPDPTCETWTRAAMSSALDNVEQGVLVLDSRYHVVLINQPARLILQLDAAEVLGTSLRNALARSPALSEGTADALHARCIDAELIEDDISLSLAGEMTANARIRPLAGQHRALFLEPGVQGRFTPGDAITGLLDRRGFVEAVRNALAVHRSGRAVMTVDLGRFKSVNDALGHPVGDALLRSVAGRLRNTLRQHDLAARLGGDEFAVLANVRSGGEDATVLARRITDLISHPFVLNGHLVNVEARAGIALAPEHGNDPETLLRRATLALRQAHHDGCEFRVFEPAMQLRAEARRELELDLRRALALGQFELHYQPLVNLVRGGLTGFEALIRWRHPKRGLVPPNDFIPLAEELGLISDVGEWVVHEACREAARWPSPLNVAVNASGVQFESGELTATVQSALQSSGLPGSRLEVEVTETALLRRGEVTLASLRDLRAMGVRIAMDDFGTGYSSLTQLQSFPFDKIKIDRSFVSRMDECRDSSAIVRAIARMGASLGLCTVAEGVETVEQLDALRAEGCDEVQGYLLGRPVPTSEIDRTISRLGV